MSNIAFLGLGAMGVRMARRLIDAGHTLVVYNRTAARAAPLTEVGATVADTPAEAVADADVVITMLTDDAAARSVWLDPTHGIITRIRPSAVALECSTVTPAWIQTLAEAIGGQSLLDAPVAGSRPQAEAGQLIFLVGGEAETLERARSLVEVMGSAIHHIGPTGAGAWMKLAVNSLFGVQVAVVAELLGMLKKAGLTPERSMEVLGALPVTSPAVMGVGGLMVAGRHAPLFPIDLVEKDFGYAIDAARSVDSRLPTVEATRQSYIDAQAAGHGGDNLSGVSKLFW